MTDLAGLVRAHEISTATVLRRARDQARAADLPPPSSLATMPAELVDELTAWITSHPAVTAARPTLDEQIDEWFAGDPDVELVGYTRREILRHVARRDAAEFVAETLSDDQWQYHEIFTGTLDVTRDQARPPAWRIDGLLAAEGRALITAQRKAGKTTLALNLVNSLITAEPFLDRYDARPATGRVGYLNYEVAAWQLARWATEHGIPDDQLWIANLRGQPNPLTTSAGRHWLTDQLTTNQIEILVVDPFERAYSGTSSNDAREVLAWLGQLDELASDAHIDELVLVHHAGWEPSRSRGSTAIEDWPDTIITLTADPDTNTRYLRAFGRDVDIPEDELAYHAATRRLTHTGNGSRTRQPPRRHDTRAPQDRQHDLDIAVLADVTTIPGLSVTERERRIRAQGLHVQRGDVGRSLQRLVDTGHIIEQRAGRGAKTHSAADLSRPIPPEQVTLTYPDPSRPPL